MTPRQSPYSQPLSAVRQSEDPAVTEFVFIDSMRPLVRAGQSNFVWPMLAMALFMLAGAQRLPAPSRIALSTFLLFAIALGVYAYRTTLARIRFEDEALTLVRSLDTVRLPYASISEVEIITLLSSQLRLRVRSRDAFFRWHAVLGGVNSLGEDLGRYGRLLRQHLEAHHVKVTGRF